MRKSKGRASINNSLLTIDDIDVSQTPALVGYYKCNEGSGSIIYDHSGNGNHLTIDIQTGNDYDAIMNNTYPGGMTSADYTAYEFSTAAEAWSQASGWFTTGPNCIATVDVTGTVLDTQDKYLVMACEFKLISPEDGLAQKKVYDSDNGTSIDYSGPYEDLTYSGFLLGGSNVGGAHNFFTRVYDQYEVVTASTIAFVTATDDITDSANGLAGFLTGDGSADTDNIILIGGAGSGTNINKDVYATSVAAGLIEAGSNVTEQAAGGSVTLRGISFSIGGTGPTEHSVTDGTEFGIAGGFDPGNFVYGSVAGSATGSSATTITSITAQDNKFGFGRSKGNHYLARRNWQVWAFDSDPGNMSTVIQWMSLNPGKIPKWWLGRS